MLLERQRGLWSRLRGAPVSKATLLTGMAVSGTLISLMILLVSFGFAMVVFRLRIQGSVLGFLGISIAGAVMASAFGLLIAALGNSPATARRVTTLAVLMMVMLDGAWGSPLTLGPGPSKRQVQSTVTNARKNFSRTYTAKQYSSRL